MMCKDKVNKKWTYLPLVFSSAAILATQAQASPDQQYPEARQVGSANYEYVGGRTQLGGNITDDGDVSVDLSHIFSETKNSSSSVGLWAGVDLDDGDGVEEGGIQLNHNWLSRDLAGNASHVNKVFAAYDRNEDDHEKATIGYGQEREHLFWEGHLSKGLSGKKKTGLTHNNREVSSKAYDYGVGGSVGTFLKGINTRIRAGIDHEWGDDVAQAFAGFPREDTATNTTLSAGIEKFFQGTPHSLSLDVAASRHDGGTELPGLDDSDVHASLGYHYDFGGAGIYQADREYRRIRVEVPGQSRPARYSKQPIYKRVATYKNVPVYGKKTVKKPYKQLVKSTMELEGQTFFKLNSARLIPSAQSRLKQIANEIRSKGYRGAIRITGNTCGLGDAAYDQRLSEQRAKAVRSFLIKQGLNADHLIARGLGKGHPRFPNTPSQGFKNRRVDIEYVTESKSYRTAYRTEQQTVRTGSRRVATGFKNVPAGFKNVLIDSGAPGTPRVIWKTEAIKTSPAWIKRALHNNIKHDRNVNTYFTTAGSVQGVVNIIPVAADDRSTTACNTPVIIKVLENDKDDDGDDLKIIRIADVDNGQAEIVGNTIKYTPDACGVTEEFSYTVSDGKGGTDTAKVEVVVGEAPVPNTAPDAQDDHKTTGVGEAVSIKVLDNDSDPEDDSLSIESFSQGSDGSVTRGSNNTLTYTPSDNFFGTDSFTYIISDGNGGTDTATVTVTVTAPEPEPENSAPTANEDKQSMACASTASINVLDNDNDPDDDTLKLIEISGVENGQAEISGNRVVFTPDADACGTTEKFTYTISDGNGATDEASVSVHIAEAQQINHQPVAVDDVVVTDMDEAVRIRVLRNDNDPDEDDLSIKSFSEGSHGSVSRGPRGVLIYTPEDGFNGDDNFVYTVSDGNGATDEATVTVMVSRVEPENNAPVAQDDSASTACRSPVILDVLNNDSDRDDDSLKIIGVEDSRAEIVANKIKFTPDACGLTEKFSYTIVDGKGGSDKAAVSVIVDDEAQENVAPVAESDQATTLEDESITLDVLQNDFDADRDSLSIASFTQASDGSVSLRGNGKLRYKPDSGFTGNDAFEYTITDGNGHSAMATVSITVEADETPDPIEVKNDTATTQEGVGISIDVLANDGNGLTITGVDLAANGFAEVVNGKRISYLPNSGFSGVDSFTYRVEDAHGQTAQATVKVTVEADTTTPNRPPNANEDSPLTDKDTPITVNVLANDTDPDGDSLEIITITQPQHGSAKIVNNRIVYTPDGTVGSMSLIYTISDGNGHTDQAVLTIAVTDPNDGNEHWPNISNEQVTIRQDESVLIDVLANDTDLDGDTLVLDEVDSGANGITEKINGKVRYTPLPGFVGTDTFFYGVHDGHGHNGSGKVTITVIE